MACLFGCAVIVLINFSSRYGKGFGFLHLLLGENSPLVQPNPVYGIVFYFLVLAFGNLSQHSPLENHSLFSFRTHQLEVCVHCSADPLHLLKLGLSLPRIHSLLHPPGSLCCLHLNLCRQLCPASALSFKKIQPEEPADRNKPTHTVYRT